MVMCTTKSRNIVNDMNPSAGLMAKPMRASAATSVASTASASGCPIQ